ncbi:MAG: PDZ domain-containing protein [Endomicrobium sp.]|jgi:hypothetical protein|nr:PDZ domain-containing protein [Endomicrobium sp.]
MIKIMSFLVSFCLLNSCYSLSSFYTPYVDTRNLNDVTLLTPNTEPEILLSNNLKDDFHEILSNHYYCIGCTSFNGPKKSKRNITRIIRRQCKATGATLAIYSVNYTHNGVGASYYLHTKPKKYYGLVYLYGNDNSNSNSYTTNYTTRLKKHNAYVYTVPKYDYIIYYFVKFTSKSKLSFGIEYTNLTAKMRQKYKRNNGIFVKVVYKGTPAFSKNILIGDIIIKINNQNINNVNDINKMLNQLNSGDILEIVLERDYKIQTIKLRLN